MSERVTLERDGRIATLRLDAPAKHNVLDRDGWQAVARALASVAGADLGCVVVRGTGGRAFSAGSDIGAFESQRTAPADVRAYSSAIGDAMRAVQTCPHPTLALVEGLCVGGGLELAASCDVRVCGTSSRFGAPITRLGLTMSHQELAPLVRLLGPGPVLEILLSGDLIGAERAREVGLVSRVYADDALVDEAYALARRVAAGAPLVNRWHKKFVRRLMDPTPLTDAEREEAHEAFETGDYREGRTAFLEKRDPEFRGE
jgi:enoyl-CoA hydratase/carnithine racemase